MKKIDFLKLMLIVAISMLYTVSVNAESKTYKDKNKIFTYTYTYHCDSSNNSKNELTASFEDKKNFWKCPDKTCTLVYFRSEDTGNVRYEVSNSSSGSSLVQLKKPHKSDRTLDGILLPAGVYDYPIAAFSEKDIKKYFGNDVCEKKSATTDNINSNNNNKKKCNKKPANYPKYFFKESTLYVTFLNGSYCEVTADYSYNSGDLSYTLNTRKYNVADYVSFNREGVRTKIANSDLTSLGIKEKDIPSFVEEDRKEMNRDNGSNIVFSTDNGTGDTCDALIGGDLTEKLNQVLDFIRYLGPILVVVFTTIDFIKTAATGNTEDLSKAGKKFAKRLGAALALFFVVLIVKMLLSVFGITVPQDCLK